MTCSAIRAVHHDGLFAAGDNTVVKGLAVEDMADSFGNIGRLFNVGWAVAGADAEPSEEGITDWADVSSFAMISIKWALANGVISGVDNLDGTRSLCPHDSASRAQMAKIILNVEAMRG